MKKLLLYLLCFFTGALFAQPVITSADLLVVGDNIVTQPLSTATFAPGNAGANQTWDFSQLAPEGDPETTYYISPVGTPYAASYPSSNITAAFDSTAYGYYQVDGGKLYYWGQTDPNTALVLTDPATYFVSPTTYGTFVLDTIAGSISLGPIAGSVAGRVFYEGDGYGTIMLPDGTTKTNVLRVKTVTVAVATVPFLGTIIDSVFNYSWYQLGIKSPVMEMIEDTQWSGGAVLDQTRFVNYYLGTLLGASDPGSGLQPVNVYPNPVSDEAVRFTGFDTPSKLIIQNSAGQCVLAEIVNPGDPVLLKKLESGVYICSIYTQGLPARTVKMVVR